MTENIKPTDESNSGQKLFVEAKPIDEYGGLGIALEIIEAKFPELTPEEQYMKALGVASSVAILENNAAGVADLRRRVDSRGDE